MGRVVAQEVGIVGDRAEVVDRDDFDIVPILLVNRPQHQATDPAETIDRHTHRHSRPPIFQLRRHGWVITARQTPIVILRAGGGPVT